MASSLLKDLQVKFKIRNKLLRSLFAEVIGTFVLSVLLHGCIAHDVVTRTGSTLNIALTIGMALALSIYTSFGVSGGHLNLTISVGVAAAGLFPWRLIPSYFVAQFVGAFIGAGVVYIVYEDTFDSIDGGVRQAFGENGTAHIFATFSPQHVSLATAFFEIALINGLLLLVAIALLDQKNLGPSLGLSPLFFGIAVFVLLMSFSYNGGGNLNPSIDLSGRIFLSIVGYGSEVWAPDGVHFWWVPLLAAVIGSAIGSWLYIAFVRMHHPDEEEDKDTEREMEYELDAVVNNKGSQTLIN